MTEHFFQREKIELELLASVEFARQRYRLGLGTLEEYRLALNDFNAFILDGRLPAISSIM